MNKIKYAFSLAVLSLAMAACSNDTDPGQSLGDNNGKGIPFTATISMAGSATRSVLTEDTEKGVITAAWAEGDALALVYKVGSVTKVTKAVMTALDDDKSAVITATLEEGVTEGTAVTLLYPYDAVIVNPEESDYGKLDFYKLIEQKGTLTDIADRFDFCQGSGKLTLAGTASLTADVKMESQIAIWKLSLTDGTNPLEATQLNIATDEEAIMAMVLLDTGTASEFYVAVPALNNGLINMAAATATGDYVYSKTGVTIEAGKYYQSTVTMELDTCVLP